MINNNIINIQNKIIFIINKIRTIPANKKENLHKFNFIENGHLDSMELLKFNLILERKFKIKIIDFDTSKKKYQTVNGLASVILKKLNR
jgi:acyl carrier protein|tara:strand:- start:315 stop:581 length:267 start_codon:yes stop_codon:yes gene_type:complete